MHRLQKHCRDLVDQRNEALAELAKVKVTLMEVMEQQVEREGEEEEEEPGQTADDSSVSEPDLISEQEVTKAPPPPPPVVCRQPTNQRQGQRLTTNQTQSQRLENQVSRHPTNQHADTP